ncbi:uncharacterized protein LOC143921688 [Arctopsyche grandis]|uniref:uncharacterized protein LOC143921688 n=1 Tax=Arctopsyche grandis TaxID=121162 RepID=UPI00406D7BDE
MDAFYFQITIPEFQYPIIWDNPIPGVYMSSVFFTHTFPTVSKMVGGEKESICLRVVEVVIPGYRVRGETALLECQYDLERDVLYSVKWYKDNEEFYRFMPRFSPPQQSYRMDGVKVDNHLSDDKRVTLKGVTLKSSGLYRCEVSAEAPSFSSVSGEGRMEVVYLPRDGPHISEQGKLYQVGDVLSLNCTSGRSYPASILHWYVNDEKITSSKELVEYAPVMHKHGLLTASLGLKLSLAPGHFPGGALRARCVARVSPVLWTADQESLVERVAPLIDNREALLLDNQWVMILLYIVANGLKPKYLSTGYHSSLGYCPIVAQNTRLPQYAGLHPG